MTTVVLRVSGERLDLGSCLAWLPAGAIQSTWRVGDKQPGGRISATSGFNLLLSEGPDARSAVAAAFSAFVLVAPQVAELVRGGANVVMDFGLFVSASGSTSIELGPGFLGCIERAGVTVAVSAYPCAD